MLTWIKNLMKSDAQKKVEWEQEMKARREREQPEDEIYSGSEPSTHIASKRRKESLLALGEKIKFKPPQITAGEESYGMDAAAMVGVTPNLFGGQAISEGVLYYFASQSFIGYQTCAILAQNWLINKACSVKGRDAVRKGFTMSFNNGDGVNEKVIPRIEELNKKFKLTKNMEEASRFNEIFGIRHVLFLVESDDPRYYEKPFNPDGIKKGAYKGMCQVDPYWLAPTFVSDAVNDPTSQTFYEPTHWIVGGKKIHRSHFVILRGAEVADYLKPQYYYGGISLAQRIYERVFAAERSANEVPQILQTKRLTVRKTDIEKAIANPEVFESALEAFADYRDNYGVNAIGLEEDISQIDTGMGDIDVNVMTQYQLVASIANTPATKLLGTSPKGFNATGEHEITAYREELESIQENDLDPIIERHLVCLTKSHLEPEFGEVGDIDVKWNPLAVETRKEKAEINEINSRTAASNIQSGITDGEDELKKLINDPDSGYSGLEMPEDEEVDLSFDPEEMAELVNNGEEEVQANE